ncbi:MAG: insulinase family protein [bacterium]|nr:insulinase family protein [bacterium]
MKYNKKTLSNGLKLITIPMKDLKSATILVLVGTGSRYESSKNNGIAHFIEHMFFKGTQKRTNTMDISSEIDSLGADYNAFTGKEYTGYYIKAASSHLKTAVDILSDMLINSKFDKDEIEREKGVIVEEINMYEDTPMRHVGDLYEQLIFQGNPLSFDTAGEKDVVRSFTREMFTDYLSNFYVANNMVVVVSGDITTQQVEPLIEEYFSPLKTRDVPSYEKYIQNQKEPLINVNYKKTDQAHFCLGLRSNQIGHPDRYATTVFNTIMGGNMSSRLFIEVRERRGFCYYISSDNEAHLDTGSWVIQAGVDVNRIDEALTTILDELKKIIKTDITPKELTKAKDYLKGKLALGLEDSKGVANLYGAGELLESKIRTPDEIIKGIDSVTIEDVSRIAKNTIKHEKLSFCVIGPYEDDTRFTKLITLK